MCNPMECLPAGAKVKVQNRVGTVTKSELVRAHPCGQVAQHTIKLTHKLVRNIGFTSKLVLLDKPKTVQPNYSFIELYNV